MSAYLAYTSQNVHRVVSITIKEPQQLSEESAWQEVIFHFPNGTAHSMYVNFMGPNPQFFEPTDPNQPLPLPIRRVEDHFKEQVPLPGADEI